MKKAFYFTSLFFGMGLSGGALADSIAESTIQSVQAEPVWHKLLHVKNGRNSDVLSKHFFLSAPGEFSPENELRATLSAFLEPQEQSKLHAQCRFPARYQWLKEKLGSQLNFKDAYCSEYEEWKSENDGDSISLVFASGYLENPASLYGHLMLKFNRPAPKNPLLDTSINYGAETPQNENPVSYVLKGIFGGYQGVFSQAEFYKNNMLYGEMELRDLWEYKLNFTPEKADFIMAHTYELINTRFTYYFFKDNCALQIADILALGGDSPLYDSERPWVLPIDVVEGLANAGQVADINLHTSRQAEFYDHYRALNEEERAYLRALTEGSSPLILNHLPNVHSKQAVLDAALDYVAFEFANNDDQKAYQKKKYALLGYQASLPTPAAPKATNFRDSMVSTKPLMVGLGLAHYDGHSGLSVRLRPAYYDGLDINVGRPKFSTLTMMDTELFIRDGRPEIKRLDFVNVESIQPSLTGLDADKDSTWRFKAGYESDSLSDGYALTTGRGISAFTNPDSVVSGLLSVKAKTGGEGVSLIPELKYLYNTEKVGASASVGYLANLDDRYSRLIGEAEIRLLSDRTQQVRFNFGIDDSPYLSVGYNRHF